MKKFWNIILLLSLIIWLIYLVNIFAYTIPIEFSFPVFNNLINFILPISLILLSIALISKNVTELTIPKYLIKFIGIIGIVLSFPLLILMTSLNGASYADKFVVYQSVDDNSEQIIQQYMDEGVFGEHWKEVRVYKICYGIRYNNRFCKTTLNGKWLKYDNKSSNVDTCDFENYIYKSKINSRTNWTTNKCYK